MEKLNKTGFFKVSYYNPKGIVFQHMSVKETVFNNRKNRHEEINRFRNGDRTQHLTSVNIEVIVRSSGYIVKIPEGFVCDNLEFNPFERFTIDMTNKKISINKKTKRHCK